MKKKDLYDALSDIDEKYLLDSENFSEISAEFKRVKMRKISTVSSLCGCSLILVAVFLSSDIMKINFNNIPEITEKLDTIQTNISDNNKNISDIMTTENKTKIENITETTENNSEISSEYSDLTENATVDNTTNENYVEPSKESVTTYISDVIDNDNNLVNEPIHTEVQTNETSKISSTDIITTTFNNTIDNYDETNFSGIPVDEWLENSDVIWSKTDTKGYLSSEYISSGNTEISEKLSDLMQNKSDDSVYAVMVDFSSCIDENELLNWEYNGNTIADLKLQISKSTEYSENSYTYVDSDGTEHIEYFLTSESEKQITELEILINEIKSAYRNAKIQEFRYSFNDNGLEIYTDRLNGIQEENFCFYTFATKKHLEEFKCKNNEAFIFYPANYFK